MLARYTDEKNKVGFSLDFTERARTGPVVICAIGCFSAYTLTMLSLFFLQNTSILTFTLTTFIIMSVLTYLILSKIRQINDVANATEFQNAIFANALKYGTEFCLILRPDGSNFYVTSKLAETFPDRTVGQISNWQELIASDLLSTEQKNDLEAAIFSDDLKALNFSFTYQGTDLFLSVQHFVTNKFSTKQTFSKKFSLLKISQIPVIIEVVESKNNNLLDPIESYLWQFIETSPIAEILLDETGVVEKYNSAFKPFANLALLADNGWNIIDMIDPRDKKEARAAIKAVKDGVDVRTFASKPITIKLIGSKEKSMLFYIGRMINTSDQPSKMIARLIDITEQKNLELHFAHSQKMQAVGQLAGGIAHDFNNLLTAMIGFSDLLLMRHPPGDQSFADVMQIKQNANRAANLVRQLLAFSRKQVLQPVVLDITDVLDESSNLIRRLIGESISLDIQHGKDLMLVKVDQVQLEQVIINLAVNARDAMSHHGLLSIKTSNIEISLDSELFSNLLAPTEDETVEPGQYVLIEVSDTGCGIPKELVSKIFEPFFSTKEIGAGTGLGLSTVYGIVKQTGGYIFLDTLENQGTKFYILLKSYEDSVAPVAQEDESEKYDKHYSSDHTGSGTILLVEDEDPVRIFATNALMNKGYTVFEAENGRVALDLMDQYGTQIDVIITDVIMPGINGPVMAEEILAKYPNIKVIFISGYAEDTFVETYGSDRSFNFLPKPFTLKQLAAKVKEVMSKNYEDA